MVLPVVCIMGPTASGKTDLACALYDKIPNSRIISVDSAMVYRGMDIGSAKPDAAMLEKYPHAMLDLFDPSDSCSVGKFVKLVTKEIDACLVDKTLPILVGGSMMYFRRLQYGVAELPAADVEYRRKLQQRSIEIGWPALHEELQQVDSIAATKIHPNDGQRIARALEIHYLTGKPISELQLQTKIDNDFNFLNIALLPRDRAWLHNRIALRVDAMLDSGFVAEVKHLQQDPRNHRNLPAIKSVGYAQLWDYCAGDIDLATSREKAIVATRRLAKHQITWLRSWDSLHEFAAEDNNVAACLELLDSEMSG